MVSRKITCKKLHNRECRKRGVVIIWRMMMDDLQQSLSRSQGLVSNDVCKWTDSNRTPMMAFHNCNTDTHIHMYQRKKMYLVLPAWVPNTCSLMKVKDTCLAFSFCQLQKHIAPCICAVGSIKDTHLQNSISWPFVFSKQQFILELFITSTKKTLNHLIAGTNSTTISQSCQMFCYCGNHFTRMVTFISPDQEGKKREHLPSLFHPCKHVLHSKNCHLHIGV